MTLRALSLSLRLLFWTALIFQFGFLQLWKVAPGLSSVPGFIGSSLCIGIIIFIAITMEGMTFRKDSQANSRVPLLAAVVTGGLCVGAWYLWAHAYLTLPMQTHGDEDFHFTVSKAVADYLASYRSFQFPEKPGPLIDRYPSLMYVLSSPFIWMNAEGATPYVQRFPLVIPFVAMAVFAAAAAHSLTKSLTVGIVTGAALATSPLLLSYTADKFLDIGHPFLFLVLSWAIFRSAEGSREWQLTGAVTAAILPFVRDNAGPTSLVAGGMLFLLAARTPLRAVLLGVVAAGPFVAYAFIKRSVSSVDAQRLSLANIMHQDYAALFQMLPVYVPWGFLLMGICAFLCKRRPIRIGLVFIVLSIAAQLFLYAIFEPGWMPWSRNYLMFFGQLVAAGIFGLAFCRDKDGSLRAIAAGVVSLSVATNLYLDATELHKNRIFHEIVVNYRYDELARFLQNRPDLLSPGSVVYSNAPVGVPDSFRVNMSSVPNVKFQWIEASPPRDTTAIAWFPSLIERSPSDATLFLYHAKGFRARLRVTSHFVAPVPAPSELNGFEVLFEAADPYSDGENRIMLLRRMHRTASPS